MPNLISLVRSMLDSGASVEEIVSSLKELGVSEEDAKRLIVLANREILLTVRNDLRKLAEDALEEKREEFLRSLREEMEKSLDLRMKMVNRNLFKMLKDEVSRYVSELSKVEERLDILEKRVFDLEKRVIGREKISVRRLVKPGAFLVLIGLFVGLVGYFLPLEPVYRVAAAIIAFVLIVGGVIVG